jgi:hypothetical protein
LNNHFENLDKLRNLNKKIIEELIEKSFSFLILNNTLMNMNDDEPSYLGQEEVETYSKLNHLKSERKDSKDSLHSYELNSVPVIKVNIKDFEKLISYLSKVRNSKNIYELLINEYLIISSEKILMN